MTLAERAAFWEDEFRHATRLYVEARRRLSVALRQSEPRVQRDILQTVREEERRDA